MSDSMKTENICAVIVTYNPDKRLKKNIIEIKDEVGKCLIIDNGTSEEKGKKLIKEVQQDFPDISLKGFPENRGIAGALNTGLVYCVENGYSLMLTMDQDTILEKNAIKELLRGLNNNGASSVGINWDRKLIRDKYTTYLITSGNLVKTNALITVGGYDEKLFIDSVDFDISLRLLDEGYKLMKIANAYASHEIGEEQLQKIFGLFTISYRSHKAERYYYMYRNHRYLIKRNWKKHKLFCVKKEIMAIFELFKLLLFDKQRCLKMQMIKKGIIDGKSL